MRVCYWSFIICGWLRAGNGAYSPDLPDCVAVGGTREEVEKNMHKAIKMHLQGMIEDHQPIPTPQTTVEYMDITFRDSVA